MFNSMSIINNYVFLERGGMCLLITEEIVQYTRTEMTSKVVRNAVEMLKVLFSLFESQFRDRFQYNID